MSSGACRSIARYKLVSESAGFPPCDFAAMSALAAGGHRDLAEEADARAAARAHAVDAAQVPRLAGRRARFLFTARDDGDEVRPLGADLEHVLLHGHAAAP